MLRLVAQGPARPVPRILALLPAVLCVSILSGGCAPKSSAVGVVARPSGGRISAKIAPVREISSVDRISVQPGGGHIAFVSEDASSNERAFSLSSWDASPAVPLGPVQGGPVWVSASNEGVYMTDVKGLRFARWTGLPARTASLGGDAIGVIPSPSGRRLFVDYGRMPSDTAHLPWPSIIEASTHRSLYTWMGSPNAGGGVAWLDESTLLFDSEAYGQNAGPILAAHLERAGRIRYKDTGLRGMWPTPSPDGRTWAYADQNGMLVLYDPISKREIGRWAARSRPEGPPSGLAWADGTHVLYVDDRLRVLDVKGALKN